MKHLMIIVIALVTISASAQQRKQGQEKTDMKAKMELRQNRTPEESAKLQTKKMTLRLDLNETQQAEIEKLLLIDAKERNFRMGEFKARQQKDEGEKFSKEDRLKMQNDRLDRQIEMKKKMKVILTAEQYEKLGNMQERRHNMQARKTHLRKQND